MMPGRCSSLDLLEPNFAASVREVVRRANAEGLPVDIFETARSPERQLVLYQQGRDPMAPGYGRTVTDAQPYESAHQFGMGTDLVFRVGGRWTWVSPVRGGWDRLVQIAEAVGLESLAPREYPHVQVRGFDWRRLPPGPPDDDGWMTWLRQRLEGAAAA